MLDGSKAAKIAANVPPSEWPMINGVFPLACCATVTTASPIDAQAEPVAEVAPE
jgi:hypothetical protein